MLNLDQLQLESIGVGVYEYRQAKQIQTMERKQMVISRIVRLHQIFNILVPTPYNYEGRDMNFEDLMQSDQDMSKRICGPEDYKIDEPGK